jgi:NAD(P)H-dependent FMN reductase
MVFNNLADKAAFNAESKQADGVLISTPEYAHVVPTDFHFILAILNTSKEVFHKPTN